MSHNPFMAGILSLLVPGLGQLSIGEWTRGAAILAAAIIIGNMNLIFLLIFIMAKPDPDIFGSYWMPRVGHDIIAIWSVLFWTWAVYDAYRVAKDS